MVHVGIAHTFMVSAGVVRTRGGGGRKKFLVPAYSYFFVGYPQRRGGGVATKKNSREIFLRAPKPEISSTLPHLFGFGRCKEDIFKVTINVSSDMGAQRPPVCSGCNAAPTVASYR